MIGPVSVDGDDDCKMLEGVMDWMCAPEVANTGDEFKDASLCLELTSAASTDSTRFNSS